MHTVDSVHVGLGVIFDGLSLLGFSGTRESSGVVGDVEASIAGTFEGTEDSGTGGGSLESDVKMSLERSPLALMFGDIIFSAISFSDTLVHTIHALLLEESPSKEKSGAVSRGVVGETGGEAEPSELKGISGAEGHVTGEGGVVNGADDSAVGDPDNESVFYGTVFIVVLNSQSFSLLVISFSL